MKFIIDTRNREVIGTISDIDNYVANSYEKIIQCDNDSYLKLIQGHYKIKDNVVLNDFNSLVIDDFDNKIELMENEQNFSWTSAKLIRKLYNLIISERIADKKSIDVNIIKAAYHINAISNKDLGDAVDAGILTQQQKRVIQKSKNEKEESRYDY